VLEELGLLTSGPKFYSESWTKLSTCSLSPYWYLRKTSTLIFEEDSNSDIWGRLQLWYLRKTPTLIFEEDSNSGLDSWLCGTPVACLYVKHLCEMCLNVKHVLYRLISVHWWLHSLVFLYLYSLWWECVYLLFLCLTALCALSIFYIWSGSLEHFVIWATSPIHLTRQLELGLILRHHRRLCDKFFLLIVRLEISVYCYYYSIISGNLAKVIWRKPHRIHSGICDSHLKQFLWVPNSLCLKQDLDPFSHVCTPSCVTGWQTPKSSVSVVHISRIRCGLKTVKNIIIDHKFLRNYPLKLTER